MKQKEIYTDLEKREPDEVFTLKLEEGWRKDFEDVNLVVGKDILFIGEPVIEKGTITYKIKIISDRAKKMFIAE